MTAGKHRTITGAQLAAELAQGKLDLHPVDLERLAEREGDPLLARDAFFSKVSERLEAGRETYGDRSFGRSCPSTLAELEQEALDLAGWGFVLWYRLRRMRQGLEALEVDTARRLAGREERG